MDWFFESIDHTLLAVGKLSAVVSFEGRYVIKGMIYNRQRMLRIVYL